MNMNGAHHRRQEVNFLPALLDSFLLYHAGSTFPICVYVCVSKWFHVAKCSSSDHKKVHFLPFNSTIDTIHVDLYVLRPY